MVSPGKPCLSCNGFMHLNRCVGIKLTQFSDTFDLVFFHFILADKYLSDKDKLIKELHQIILQTFKHTVHADGKGGRLNEDIASLPVKYRKPE